MGEFQLLLSISVGLMVYFNEAHLNPMVLKLMDRRIEAGSGHQIDASRPEHEYRKHGRGIALGVAGIAAFGFYELYAILGNVIGLLGILLFILILINATTEAL